MPELAEVDFYRQRWQVAGAGRRVVAVRLHPRAKVFRGMHPTDLTRTLPGLRMRSSATAAKQMLFRFGRNVWLGIHLGMSGELRAEPPTYSPQKHDLLVLVTSGPQLVFSDPRMFGRVQFHVGPKPPTWWTSSSRWCTCS